MDAASTIWTLLGVVVWPLWLGAGVVDYACHARAHIERTTGPTEAALHLVQVLQIGLAVVLVLVFEATPIVVGCATAMVLLHTVTALLDLRYTWPRRPIALLEHLRMRS